MPQLANKLNREQALKKLAAEPFARQTVSFYRYVPIENPQTLRDQLFLEWENLGVLGRVYLATEGINAQISVPKPNLEKFRAAIDASPAFSQVEFKYALEEPATSFWKLTIKVREQIVADDLDPHSYDLSNVGTHLNAQEFNAAMDAGAIVVDMRNKYESDIGKFENAVAPQSQTFGDELQEVIKLLDDKKNEKVLLYCTGGIRCEKASAFLKHNGFNDVSQLYGGIINYKHEVEQAGLESKFKGKNFVFDGRMAETVTPDVLGKCFTCKAPADTYDNCSSDLCHALFIQCAKCRESMLGACSQECRTIAALPAEERIKIRKGRKAQFKILSS
ncbi:MAG TPA: rhodanese-related sulfurtransferase [bacterium]|nr:rhodanese-related sulfurtransferase [bacterium]